MTHYSVINFTKKNSLHNNVWVIAKCYICKKINYRDIAIFGFCVLLFGSNEAPPNVRDSRDRFKKTLKYAVRTRFFTKKRKGERQKKNMRVHRGTASAVNKARKGRAALRRWLPHASHTRDRARDFARNEHTRPLALVITGQATTRLFLTWY